MFEGKFFIRLVFTKTWYNTNVRYSYNDITPPDTYIDDEYGEVMIYSNFDDDFDYEGDYNLLDDWLAYGDDLVDFDNNKEFQVKLDDFEDNIDDFCDSVYEYLEDKEIKDKNLWDLIENFHQCSLLGF